MFFWCWISINQGSNYSFRNFIFVSVFLYYLWHILLWIFSLVVIVWAGCILWGHLAASSETRKFVLKQNLYYVLVLGIETVLVMIIWIVQLGVATRDSSGKVFFLMKLDLGLAVTFAVVHSLRGVIDLVVWLWTFSIGPMDVKDMWRRHKLRYSSSKKDLQVPVTTSTHLNTPLLTTGKKDNLVNKALRRNAIYCINVGILDAVQLHIDRCRRTHRVGSVREPFSAQAMLELDQENQNDELARLYSNPNYRDQSLRKIQFPASSSHLKEFSFIDLEPRIFSTLREAYQISPRTYRKSFEIKNASDIDSSRMLEKFTEGKSGSFFYFTQDYRFIIKTVTNAEEKFLRKIAYSYYLHMKDNEDSLLARFFGLHKVRLAPEQRYITVVVMENILNSDRLKIHRKYDLKGSWVGRRSLKGGQKLDRYKGTLKDLDLGEEKIFIGSDLKEQLMEQLRRDVAFLQRCRIMDYSLLLGIHNHGSNETSSGLSSPFSTTSAIDVDFTCVETEVSPRTSSVDKDNRHGTITSMVSGFEGQDLYVPWFRQDDGGLRSNSRYHPFSRNSSRPVSVALTESHRDSLISVGSPPATYFFGVIDILQEYTLRKKVEHVVKTRLLRQDQHGISAVNEIEYGERFLKFLDSIIE